MCTNHLHNAAEHIYELLDVFIGNKLDSDIPDGHGVKIGVECSALRVGEAIITVLWSEIQVSHIDVFIESLKYI